MAYAAGIGGPVSNFGTIKQGQENPSAVIPIVGKIIAAYGRVEFPDGTFGYTSISTTYEIEATLPKTGTVTLRGQVPEIRHWGNTDIRIDAQAMVLKSVPGYWIAGQARWYFTEPPEIGNCPTTVGGNGQQSPLVRGLTFDPRTTPPPPDLPPVDGGPTDAPAGPPNAPGSGEE